MTSLKNKILLQVLKNTPIILFVTIFILFGILSPKYFTYANFENILGSASYIGIVGVGVTFVLLTGGIDLSVGAIMYLSAVTAGLLIQNYGFPVWLTLIAATCVGTLFGAFNAFCIVKLKILPFLVTFSTMVAGRGLTLFLTKSQVLLLPASITSIGSVRYFGIPLPIIIFVIIVLVAAVFLKFSPKGPQIYAVGNDIEAAKKAGINTTRIQIMVYVVSGFLAAIGGIVSVAQLGNINAGFASGYEFNAIAAVVLGGTSMYGGIGSVFPGTVIGTVLIQMVQAGLVFLQINIYLQPLFSAAIIFLAVFLDSYRNKKIMKLERRNIRLK